MPKLDLKEHIKLSSYEEILGANTEGENIKIIPLESLKPFRNHPFRVVDDEMAELVESIKEKGILTPAIVRKSIDGGYEIISGHRRKRACEMAGLKEMPVIIKELDDDEATILMVDANIQREKILPSEKAHAYSMKYEVWKHQGKKGGNTLDEIGEAAGEVGKTVQRYIWLSNLSDKLLDFVDDKRLSIKAGDQISFLNIEAQKWVEELIDTNNTNISEEKAKKIRKYSDENKLTKELLFEILSLEKPPERKIVLKNEHLSKYFSEDITNEEIEKTLIMLLEEWQKKVTSGPGVQK